MDILSKLPFVSSGEDAVEDTAELGEVEAKKARIDFHRRSVRNGPANFKSPTSGQIRRAKVRALAASTKRARRAQIRQFHADQREASILRGHLQAAGVIAYANPERMASPQQALASVVWIVQRFGGDFADETGRVEVTMEVISSSLTAALNAWQCLVGQDVTPLSPAYQLPVALSA